MTRLLARSSSLVLGLALLVAVKEHVARRWQLHPAQLAVAFADRSAAHDAPDARRMICQ